MKPMHTIKAKGETYKPMHAEPCPPQKRLHGLKKKRSVSESAFT
jgi:hypothetical protein